MAIAEQLVIKAKLDLSGVASDIAKLRSQLEDASKVNSVAAIDIEAKKAALLDAQIAKELAAVEKINAAKEQAAQREQARQDALIAKQEQAAQREQARQEQAAAKQQQVAVNLIGSLEKQKAGLVARTAEGDGDRQAAAIAQELLRYKQQIADIDAKLIDPADIANARGLADEINRLNLDKIEADFEKAGAVTFGEFLSGTTERARDLAEQLQFTSQVLGNIGSTFTQFGDQAKAAFAEFDVAKTKVATLTNQSDGFAATAVKLANSLNNQVTSAEILTAQYDILSSGFTNVKDASEIARVSVLGAKAGFTDTATVADATTSVLNAYGKSASDAALLVDQFAVVQDKGKTTIGQFAGQLGNIAPIAKAAGVSFEEVAAAIATVTASGVQTSSAVSGTRQAIVNLLRPTGDAIKQLEKYGITNSAAALKAGGLVGVLGTLASKGATSSEQLSKIFTDVDGLAAVLPLVSGNLGKFNENLSAVQNAAGKAQSGFDVVANSASGRITEALNKANEALVNVGRGATVAFAPFIDIAGDAIGIFNQLPPPIQTAAGAITGLAGALFTGAAGLAAAGAAAPAFVAGLKLIGFEAGKATLASVALTTVTSVQAATYAILSKEITFNTIARKTNVAWTAISEGTTKAWTATTLFASGVVKALTTDITKLGIQQAITASIGKASFAGFAAGVAGLLTPLGLVAAAIAALAIGVKPFFDAFDNSEVNKSLEETRQKLKQIREERGKVDPTEKEDDQFGNKGWFQNPFDGSGARQRDTIRIGEELTSGKSESTRILNESIKTLQDFGQANADVAKRTKLSVEKQLEFNKAIGGEKEEIDALIEGRKALITKVGEGTPAAKLIRGDILTLEARKKLLDQRLADVKASTEKEAQIIEEATKEQRKKAARILEERNQDSERGIKRSQEDAKTKRDIANAKIISDIEEQNAAKKRDRDQKFALQTEDLKAKQAIALQDRQRAFEDGQNAKKLAVEKAIEDRKRAFDAKQQADQRAFEKAQNAAKEAFAAQQRAEDEKFAKARAERDKQNETAVSGAKRAIADEAKIGTASPEDKAKIAAQVAEEDRIRREAAARGQGGVQNQEQLIAQAKQIAQVQAIATQEEQTKVQLALDELITANKAKQAELDAAEEAKKQAARQAAEKAFDEQQNLAKQAFDNQQKIAALAFENDILKPQKLAVEKEIEAQKLAFERGELAELKKAQAAEERALKLQQETEDLAFKKQAEAELDKIKQEQKAKEVELDRKFEDEKIARERAFKESQRALDKASAIEIQQILGKSAQQIIDAIAVAKGASNFSGAVGIGKIPAFANGGVSSGGIALVGERGAELVNLPRGASVTPAIETRSLLSKGNDNSRIEALLQQLVGSVSRPPLTIQTVDDPAAIAANFYRNMAIQDAQRSGI